MYPALAFPTAAKGSKSGAWSLLMRLLVYLKLWQFAFSIPATAMAMLYRIIMLVQPLAGSLSAAASTAVLTDHAIQRELGLGRDVENFIRYTCRKKCNQILTESKIASCSVVNFPLRSVF